LWIVHKYGVVVVRSLCITCDLCVNNNTKQLKQTTVQADVAMIRA